MKFLYFTENRSQQVMVDGCRSKLVNVVSGVPQGCGLGPLLFLLYTSELFTILEKKLIGYTDDSTLMAVVPSPGVRVAVAESLTRSFLCSSRWRHLGRVSSSSRTDRWVHFQQNAGLRLFADTWIVHGIVDCYQLTRTLDGFSAQCVSKLFLKEFTVLLLTASLGRAFQVVVILIG